MHGRRRSGTEAVFRQEPSDGGGAKRGLGTKQGLILRGAGRAFVQGQALVVAMTTSRLTSWVGATTRTTRLRPGQA